MEKIKEVELSSLDFEPDYFGKWTNELENLEELYKNAKPYSHVIIDNFLNDDVAKNLEKNFGKPSNKWWHYSNPIEEKFAFDNINEMNAELRKYFLMICKPEFVDYLKKITGIDDLEYDPYFHGAGMHYHTQDGKLNMHLDYSINPYSKKERRLNIIYFLNENWKEEWNGFTELWNDGLKKCKTKVAPLFNRALLFRTFDESWHGLPSYVKCPDDTGRLSLAIYYVSEPRKDANLRSKALFSIRPEDPFDERMKKLEEIRANRRITDEDLQEIWPNWKKEAKEMYDFDSVLE